MVKADILRGPLGQQYAFIPAHHERRLKAVTFDTRIGCVNFLKGFDASAQTWLRIASTQDGFADWHSLHRHQALEEFIAGLIVGNRLRVCRVNTRLVTLNASSDAASILCFIDPSAVLVRHLIKRWSFTQAAEVEAEVSRLGLLDSELHALEAAFGVPLQHGPKRLAGLKERLHSGALLLVALPRTGKVAQAEPLSVPSRARFTTPPPASFQGAKPAPLALVQAAPVAAQVQALKQAATTGAALCEKCTPKTALTAVPAPKAANLRPALSAQVQALKEAAANGQALCERCPEPSARAAAS